MAYLTYDEYVQYGGTMDEASFTLAEFKARSRIDWMTDCRVQAMQKVPEEVKMAMLCIIKVDSKYSADAMTDSAIVASYSTDGYSESYGGITDQAEAADKGIVEEVSRMLYGVKDDAGTPLLYRGAY